MKNDILTEKPDKYKDVYDQEVKNTSGHDNGGQGNE